MTRWFVAAWVLALGMTAVAQPRRSAERLTEAPVPLPARLDRSLSPDQETAMTAIREALAEPARAVPLLAAGLDDPSDALRPQLLEWLREPALRRAYGEKYDAPARKALDELLVGKEDRVAALVAFVRRYEPTPVADDALQHLLVELVRRNRPAEVLGARRLLTARLPEARWKEDTLDAVNSLDCCPKPVAPDAEPPGTKVIWSRETTEIVPAQFPNSSPLAFLRREDAALREKGLPVPVALRPELALAVVFGGNGAALTWADHVGAQAFDPPSGRRFWSAPSIVGLHRLLLSSVRVGMAMSALDQFQGTTAIFDNTRLGHVRVGNGLLYQVVDLAVRPPHGRFPIRPALPLPGHDDENQNRLQAWSMATGKLRWSAGQRWVGEDIRVVGGYFLGAPLVLGESLLALHEKDRELRLVRLYGRTGDVHDVRPLGTPTLSLGTDPTASRRAHHLVAANGVVIVPTGCGELIGLDLPTLSVRWRYAYHENAEAPPGPGIAFEPFVAGDRLYYAGLDSGKLHALDPLTGVAAWTVPVADGDQHLASVHGGGVLVVGAKTLRRLDAATGKTLWSLETGLVAGEGYEGKGGLYYHPVVGDKGGADAVVVVDLAQGKEVRRIAMPKGFRLGNLVPMGPLVVNATPFAVSVLGEGR